MQASRMPYDGGVAALLLAAALALLVARLLPVHFDYQPNDLGIVSVVSQLQYPKQQESFWLLFCVGSGVLFSWVLARLLRRTQASVGRVAGIELAAAAALCGLLWLPGVAGFAAFAAFAALVAWLARQAGSRGTASATPQTLGDRQRAATWLWLPVMVALGMLQRPYLGVQVWNLAQGVPDLELSKASFRFLAESGQHLAWANSLSRGGAQGRDFFCLYGPFFDLGLVGWWSLVGRSVAAWEVYRSLSFAIGFVCLAAATVALVRHRFVILALPFLVPYVQLRVGLALLAFLFLALWLRTGRRSWCAASGMAAGVSLLYSQEYGVAFLLAAAVGLAVRRDARAALLLSAGAAAVVLPVLLVYASRGALSPMLRDIASYPGYVMAGYANLPFPALFAGLPLGFSELATPRSAQLRLAYAVPAICVAGLVLSLELSRLDPRHPLSSMRELGHRLAGDPTRHAAFLMALFGLVSFRSALGRSDLDHLQAAMPGAAAVFCIGIDRTLSLWRAGSAVRPLAAARSALLIALVVVGGFAQTTKPVANAARFVRLTVDRARSDYRSVGSRQVARVVRWVTRKTGPTEPVLFLPNDAAYYYLTDRPNPIRFVLGHQIVGDDHRREVLRDLQRDPPRIIAWDHSAWAVDEIPHEVVLGNEVMDWIERNYETLTKVGPVEMLRRKPDPLGRP